MGVVSEKLLAPSIASQPLFGFFSKRIAAELESRQEEEGRLAAERSFYAAQKMESLGVLAGGIAHDFNNLLTSILGNSELAQASLAQLVPQAGETARAHLAEIESASHKAADLCRQMLIYSGKSPLERQNLSINQLISEIGSLLEVSLSKDCTLEMELDEGISWIEGDSAGLQQVILNLIQNAAESLEDRAGRVLVRTRQVTLQAEELDSLILGECMASGLHQVMEVSDNGKGMTPDLMARIFDPFFTTKAEGHGLGLAAMLGILKGHKGGVSVSSNPGRGTRFRVFLPAKLGLEPALLSDMEDCGLSEENPNSLYRILVVDDEVSVLGVAQRILEMCGHEVLRAENGHQAIEILDANTRIQLLLLDVTMPGMDGLELLREMERMGIEIPVLLMTGHAQQEILEVSTGNLIKGILRKPFGIQALRQAVTKAMQGADF